MSKILGTISGWATDLSTAKDFSEAVDGVTAVPSPADPSEDEVFKGNEDERRSEVEPSTFWVVFVSCGLIWWSPHFACAKTLFLSFQTSSFNSFNSARSVFRLDVASFSACWIWSCSCFFFKRHLFAATRLHSRCRALSGAWTFEKRGLLGPTWGLKSWLNKMLCGNRHSLWEIS